MIGHEHARMPAVRPGCLALTLAGLAVLAGCQRPFAPRPGDLLFQDADGGKLSDVIEAVTCGVGGARFSHVGIVATDAAGGLEVIEAAGKVKTTPLAKFLARSRDARGRPKVVVGRLKPAHAECAAPAVARARALVGQPYDDVFLMDNGKYYCSELVYEVFRVAPTGVGGRPAEGEPLFELHPMTFRLPGAAGPLPVWLEYYASKGMAVPEGQPGCNPGGLSRSGKLEIVYAFGRPGGWSEGQYRRLAGGRN